jgi:acetoacetate decarboxylase
MPFGTLDIQNSNECIPLGQPIFPSGTNGFSDMNLLVISYQTAARNLQAMIPRYLELEEEPLVKVVLFTTA